MSSSADKNGPAINRLLGGDEADNKRKEPREVTEGEWRKVLTAEQFDVTRRAGTEAPFTGKYDKHFVGGGKYTCICCGADLFVSEHKFNSGCGWPAFSKSIDGDKNIVRIPDKSIPFRPRTEVRCSQCNAHLGHVFDDGPPAQGGERYCINSVAIDFVPGGGKEEKKE